jgi:hypothetical protein
MSELSEDMVKDLLDDIDAYLDDRADVDDGRANTAMRLLTQLRDARERGEL